MQAYFLAGAVVQVGKLGINVAAHSYKCVASRGAVNLTAKQVAINDGKAIIVKESLKKETQIITKTSQSRLAPNSNATGSHTTFRRNGSTGEITHYETFKIQCNPRNPNPWESVKRYDGVGSKGHYNKILQRRVDSPHVHDPSFSGGVREAELWEMVR